MFFDVFDALCTERNVAKTTACVDCGLSRAAWRKWTDGGAPNAQSTRKLAEYFGVSPDFLLGYDSESYSFVMRSKLDDAEKRYKSAKTDDERQEIACEIDGLKESLTDVAYTDAISKRSKKEKPSENGELEESIEILLNCPDVRTLVIATKGMSAVQIRQIAGFILSMRKQPNVEDV